jgi:hypothetical protein
MSVTTKLLPEGTTNGTVTATVAVKDKTVVSSKSTYIGMGFDDQCISGKTVSTGKN